MSIIFNKNTQTISSSGEGVRTFSSLTEMEGTTGTTGELAVNLETNLTYIFNNSIWNETKFTQTELEGLFQAKGNYLIDDTNDPFVKQSGLPDLTDNLTKTDAETLYQTKGNYLIQDTNDPYVKQSEIPASEGGTSIKQVQVLDEDFDNKEIPKTLDSVGVNSKTQTISKAILGQDSLEKRNAWTSNVSPYEFYVNASSTASSSYPLSNLLSETPTYAGYWKTALTANVEEYINIYTRTDAKAPLHLKGFSLESDPNVAAPLSVRLEGMKEEAGTWEIIHDYTVEDWLTKTTQFFYIDKPDFFFQYRVYLGKEASGEVGLRRLKMYEGEFIHQTVPFNVFDGELPSFANIGTVAKVNEMAKIFLETNKYDLPVFTSEADVETQGYEIKTDSYQTTIYNTSNENSGDWRPSTNPTEVYYTLPQKEAFTSLIIHPQDSYRPEGIEIYGLNEEGGPEELLFSSLTSDTFNISAGQESKYLTRRLTGRSEFVFPFNNVGNYQTYKIILTGLSKRINYINFHQGGWVNYNEQITKDEKGIYRYKDTGDLVSEVVVKDTQAELHIPKYRNDVAFTREEGFVIANNPENGGNVFTGLKTFDDFTKEGITIEEILPSSTTSTLTNTLLDENEEDGFSSNYKYDIKIKLTFEQATQLNSIFKEHSYYLSRDYTAKDWMLLGSNGAGDASIITNANYETTLAGDTEWDVLIDVVGEAAWTEAGTNKYIIEKPKPYKYYVLHLRMYKYQNFRYKRIYFGGFGWAALENHINVKNHLSIQEALDEAKTSEKSTVFFPDGAYLVDTPLKVSSNTKIKLSKNAVIKRNADISSIFYADLEGGTGLYNDFQNVEFEGGTIDGNALIETRCSFIAFAHGKNVNIKDITFKNGHSWHFIEINSSKNVKVKDCQFLDYGFNGSVDATEAIQIDYAFETGYPWAGTVYDNTFCENVSIEDCYFENGATAIGTHSGLQDNTHKGITIKNNYFVNHNKYIIKALNWNNVLIENNIMEDAEGGIYLYAEHLTDNDNVKIINNTLTNINKTTSSRAITLKGKRLAETIKNILLKNNRVDVVGSHGVGMDYCENGTVEGNKITQCGNVGLWVGYGGNNHNVINNIVENNNTTLASYTHDLQFGYEPNADQPSIIAIGNRATTIGFNNISKSIVKNNFVEGATFTRGTQQTSIIKENYFNGSFVDTTV